MGNADLRDVAVIRGVGFDELGGSVVAIDAHNWLYRYLTTTVKFTRDEVYTTAAGEEVANLVGVVQGLPKFFEHDLTPVFVFDGGVTDLKSDEVERRRAQREKAEAQKKAAEEAGESVKAARLEARTQRLTDVIHETTRGLFDRLDVPYIEAPAEGEAQCAHMAAVGDVDYAGSEDYDTMTFGAPKTLRQLTSKGDPELMDLEATLEKHAITREQLVDIAILMGTDFNDGVSGYGPKTAVKAIKEHGDLPALMAAKDIDVPEYEAVYDLFLHPPVTDDYEVPTSINPDMAAARAYVCEEWEVPEAKVARGFERIEESLVQTGLDDWV